MAKTTATALVLVFLALGAGIITGAENTGDRYIIRKIALAHCKRGPARCETCRRGGEKKYCLLDIAPKGEMQRRVIEVERRGKKEMREFDVARVFKSLPEAQAYAAAHGITDAAWDADDLVNARIDDDEVLKKIAGALPGGWRMAIDENRLVVERKEPVWILFENRINGPLSMESEQARAERLRKSGHQTVCGLIFSLEPLWTKERLKSARSANKAVQKSLERLPAQMGIAHLYNRSLSRKGEPVYTPGSDRDKALVEAWENKRAELRKSLVVLPDYHTRWYSLTVLSREGAEDELHIVDPRVASEELARAESLFRCFGTPGN